MRNLYIITLLFVSASMLGQQLPKIKGSGIVTLEDITITDPFDRIDLDGDFDIELR